MRTTDYYLAGRIHLLNSPSCLNAPLISYRATRYPHHFWIKPFNFEFDVIDWLLKQIIVKDLHLKTRFFKSRCNIS